MTEDLKDLPPGARIILRTGNRTDVSDAEIECCQVNIYKSWQAGQRVFVLSPGCDFFIVTPDGKVTGTAPGAVLAADADRPVTVQVGA